MIRMRGMGMRMRMRMGMVGVIMMGVIRVTGLEELHLKMMGFEGLHSKINRVERLSAN